MALGWLGQLWLLRAWLTHQGWKACRDGEPCSSGASRSSPWVWQPETLQVPLPAGNKPSWLLGPVPVSWWGELQQAEDHFHGVLVGQQGK